MQQINYVHPLNNSLNHPLHICCWRCRSGHSGGNGDDDTNSEYSDVNLDDSDARDIPIKKKSNYTKRE
jgi:hypothetical protein